MGIDKTKRQRRQALRALIIRLVTSATIATLIAVCFYAYNFLTTAEKLAINNIEFSGLNRIDSAEVEETVADLMGENILLVPLESYEARFSRHPRIRRAEFKRVLPNRVVCTVTEREPVALVYSNKFLEVDADGMIMTSDELTGLLDLPIITGVDGAAIKEGRHCDNVDLAGALEILMLCKKYGGRFADDISELRVSENEISIISLSEGVVLLLGQAKFENRLKKYFLLRDTIAEKDDATKLIDLRFDDQIVLRSGI